MYACMCYRPRTHRHCTSTEREGGEGPHPCCTNTPSRQETRKKEKALEARSSVASVGCSDAVELDARSFPQRSQQESGTVM